MTDRKSTRRTRLRPRVTGLRFREELIKEAKHAAIDDGLTLTELINRAIQEYLGRRRAGQR